MSHDPCYLFVYIRWVWHVNLFSVCVCVRETVVHLQQENKTLCVQESSYRHRLEELQTQLEDSQRCQNTLETQNRSVCLCVMCVRYISVWSVTCSLSLSLCVSGWVSSRSQSWALRWRSCRELYRSRTARPRTSVTHTHTHTHTQKTDSSRHDCVWAKITLFSPQTLSAAVWWTICLI